MEKEPTVAAAAYPAAGTRNQLLRSLSRADLALLTPHLRSVPFAIGDVLARAGSPVDAICFPEDGIAGILDTLDKERQFAVGLVGSEGFIGWPLLLGDSRSPWDVVMRAERGMALRMPAQALVAAVAASDTLRRALLTFAYAFMLQMSRTIVSAVAHPVERRLARWVLLYHDRVHEDDICMTHEEFRLMLGVRRSSVTEALRRLEEEQAIRSLRGRVIVRDRAKLILLAGDTYGHSEREYRRLLTASEELRDAS